MNEFHAYQLMTLTIMVLLSWALPTRWQMPAISCLTVAFFAWQSPISLILLATSSLMVFWGTQYNQKGTYMIPLLIAYCALQFLIVRIIQLYVDSTYYLTSVLGIAYYTCRNIHYIVECFAGRISNNATVFFHYHFFLPVIVAGPINRYQQFSLQIQRRRWDNTQFSNALSRVLVGYIKVIPLANYIITIKLPEFLGLVENPILSQ